MGEEQALNFLEGGTGAVLSFSPFQSAKNGTHTGSQKNLQLTGQLKNVGHAYCFMRQFGVMVQYFQKQKIMLLN